MVRSTRCAAVDVKRYSEILEGLLYQVVIAVHHLLHGNTLLAGTDGNGHAMLVAAAYEYHVTSLQTQVAYIYVRRNIHTRQMPYMHRAVGIRQSRCNGGSLESLAHTYLIYLAKSVRRMSPSLMNVSCIANAADSS